MKKKLAMLLLAGAMAFGTASVSFAESNPGSYSLQSDDTLLQVQVALDGALNWDVEPIIGGDSVQFLNGSVEGSYWTGNFIASGTAAGSSRIEVMCYLNGAVNAYYILDVYVSENYADLEVTNAYGDVVSADEGTGSGSSDSGSSDSGSSSSDSSSSSDTYIDATDFGQAGFSSYTAYVTAQGGLNVRAGNGSGYEVRGGLNYGDAVLVVGMTSDGWAMVISGNGSGSVLGYCSADFLSNTNPANGSTTETEKATEKTTEKTTSKTTTKTTTSTTTTTTTGSETAQSEEEEQWYELSESQDALTLTLPLEDADNYIWNYEISDEAVLELLTQENAEDADGEAYWAASFIGTGKKAGIITLTATQTMKDQEEIYMIYDMKLNVTKDGAIKVVSGEKHWFSVEPESGVLTMNLAGNESGGYAWTYDIEDESIVEVLTTEYVEETSEFSGIDGYWAASFRGLAEGQTTLQFGYFEDGEDTPEELRELEITVDADGKIAVADYTIEK